MRYGSWAEEGSNWTDGYPAACDILAYVLASQRLRPEPLAFRF
jgi:hypothetical protein